MIEKMASKEAQKQIQLYSTRNKSYGLNYFCSILDMGSNMNLVQNVLDFIQSDKKAKDWAKLLISCDEQAIVGVIYVPSYLQETLNATDWMNHISGTCLPETNILEINLMYVKFVFNPSKDKEVFTFKLLNEIVQQSMNIFKQRKIISDEESEEEDYSASLDW